MRSLVLSGCLAVASMQAAFAQSTPTPPPPAATSAEPIVDLDTVVVSGSQPGPGLWQVRKSDHVLWILGTLSPLPRRMEWDTNAVEQAIAQSQQIIASPSVGVKADVGFFGKLALIPTALKARRNPGDKTLQDVVPPDQYIRWQALKARYIGGDRGIERWRPVFAALELYDKAIGKSGMTWSGIVAPAVEKLARKHGVKSVQPKVEIAIAKPKLALKEFADQPLDDLACFEKTLDRIQGDLGNMAARANAWAIGDIGALRDLPANNQFVACSAAFTEAGLARKYGVNDLAQQMERKWLAAAETALQNNASTFATLPVSELLKDNGYLAKLRAKGYEVQAP